MTPDPDNKKARPSDRPKRHRSHIRRRSPRPEDTQRVRELGERHSDPTLVEKRNAPHDASVGQEPSQDLRRAASNPPPALPEPPLARPLPPPPPMPTVEMNALRFELDEDDEDGKTTRTDIIAIAVLAALVGAMLVVLFSRMIGQ